ncbi:MAG: hypothetical protein V3R81_14045 [Gammaproteobacteria bacterium]
MKAQAIKLADEINSMTGQESIEALIQKRAAELNVDANQLFRQAQNEYYNKYERGSHQVSPQASVNVR